VSVDRTFFRTGTTKEWESRGSSIVLAKGEPGFDSTLGVLKVGDGKHDWAHLGGAAYKDPSPTENLDVKVDPTQKASLSVLWAGIAAEYPTIVQSALTQGLSEDDLEPYRTAYNNLDSFLNGPEGLLLDLTTTTILDKPVSSFGLVDAYYSEKELVLKRISEVIREVTSHTFFEEPVPPYKVGDLWIKDGVLYQAAVARLAGEQFVLGDWLWCIRSNITVVIESTNGDKFKPGQSTSTTLKARLFRNGIEVTDEVPESNFRWIKKSFFDDPVGDSLWNSNHQGGYREVEVTTDLVNCRATYTVEITEPD